MASNRLRKPKKTVRLNHSGKTPQDITVEQAAIGLSRTMKAHDKDGKQKTLRESSKKGGGATNSSGRDLITANKEDTGLTPSRSINR